MSDLKILETLTIVGYEGGQSLDGKPLPMSWGPAAVRDKRGVYNAALGSPYQPRADAEEWADYVKEGSASETEVPIELVGNPLADYCIVDLRKDLAERPPYKPLMSDLPQVQGIITIAHGPTRTYYVFESYKRMETWLYHLQVGHFELISSP